MTRGHIAYLSDKATAGNFSYPHWRDEKAAANNIVPLRRQICKVP